MKGYSPWLGCSGGGRPEANPCDCCHVSTGAEVDFVHIDALVYLANMCTGGPKGGEGKLESACVGHIIDVSECG